MCLRYTGYVYGTTHSGRVRIQTAIVFSDICGYTAMTAKDEKA